MLIQRFLLTSLTIVTLQMALYAAAPITHIYFAEQFIKKCKKEYTQKEKESFMRGTLWPDIRRLARIPRTKTHDKDVKLHDIIDAKDPFTAGRLLHCFVDEQRERITIREKVYDLISMVPKNHQSKFLKGVEDEILYADINVKESLAALKEYDKAERKGGIAQYDVRAWHKHLTTYLKQSPSDFLHERVRQKRGVLNFSALQVSMSSQLLDDFSKNKKMVTYVKTMTKEINALFVC